MAKKLYRFPNNGKIAGVCSGFSVYFDLDPLIIRILMLTLAIFGPGALIYIISWILIPAWTDSLR